MSNGPDSRSLIEPRSDVFTCVTFLEGVTAFTDTQNYIQKPRISSNCNAHVQVHLILLASRSEKAALRSRTVIQRHICPGDVRIEKNILLEVIKAMKAETT